MSDPFEEAVARVARYSMAAPGDSGRVEIRPQPDDGAFYEWFAQMERPEGEGWTLLDNATPNPPMVWVRRINPVVPSDDL